MSEPRRLTRDVPRTIEPSSTGVRFVRSTRVGGRRRAPCCGRLRRGDMVAILENAEQGRRAKSVLERSFGNRELCLQIGQEILDCRNPRSRRSLLRRVVDSITLDREFSNNCVAYARNGRSALWGARSD